MRKKDLREFNPEEIAQIETAFWRAYYNHQFFKLFKITLSLLRVQFGLDFWNSVKAAYYAAKANKHFRLHKPTQDENQDIVALYMTKFWKVVSDHATKPFDYEAVGKAEALWWFIDRYPNRYTMTREEGMQNEMAIMYGVPPEKLVEYAKARSQAAVLLDDLKDVEKEGDWKEVENLLGQTYWALHGAVR